MNLTSAGSGNGKRRGTVAEGFIDDRGDAERDFIFEGTGDDLDADGQRFGRAADGNDCGGRAEGVEPLGVAHGVKIFDGAAIDGPAALAMAEGGNAGDGTDEDWMATHPVL